MSRKKRSGTTAQCVDNVMRITYDRKCAPKGTRKKNRKLKRANHPPIEYIREFMAKKAAKNRQLLALPAPPSSIPPMRGYNLRSRGG